MSDLVARLDSKPLFVSDELTHYANTLADAFHDVDITPKTGNPGRPAGPKKLSTRTWTMLRSTRLEREQE